MTLLEWVLSHIGRRVTAPGGDGGECVDLTNLYVAEMYQGPHVWLNAVDWPKAPLKGWDWEKNGPINKPPRGAIVVWGPSRALGIGTYGHVAVCLQSETMLMLTFDQNWSGEACQIILHSYTGVLGWLYPRVPLP